MIQELVGIIEGHKSNGGDTTNTYYVENKIQNGEKRMYVIRVHNTIQHQYQSQKERRDHLPLWSAARAIARSNPVIPFTIASAMTTSA